MKPSKCTDWKKKSTTTTQEPEQERGSPTQTAANKNATEPSNTTQDVPRHVPRPQIQGAAQLKSHHVTLTVRYQEASG